MGVAATERVVDLALKENFLVEVEYVSKNGVFHRRIMEPLSIVHNYTVRRHTLFGRCLEHNRVEPRELKRIKAIRLVDVHTSERKGTQ
jgi:hypothetical protein